MNGRIILSLFLSCFYSFCFYGQNTIRTCNYEVNLENDAVHRFLQEVIYEPHDASLTDNYRNGLTYRVDWQNPVVVDIPQCNSDSVFIFCCDDVTLNDSLTFHVPATNSSVKLYNFIPKRVYRYEIKNGDELLQRGKIRTDGQVRMIKVCNEVLNVRDLGGWKTSDNMQLRYGRLFRGTELNGTHIATTEGIDILRQLGVEAELDMRADYNDDYNISAFGFTDDSSTGVPTYYYTSDSGQLPSHITNKTYLNKWRLEFEFIVNNLRQGRAVYEHCVYGRDRTGYLSFLLEGILGMSYSDLIKDYELSFLFNNSQKSTKDNLDKVFDYINTMSGETLRDKFNTFFIDKMGVKQSDIDYFRSEMLEAIKPEVSCDVNGDDKTTADDVVAIIDYIAGKNVGIPVEAADVNKDNIVNIADVIKVVNIYSQLWNY